MACSTNEGSVIMEEEEDGNRSMKSANNNKLLVTFKAENQVIESLSPVPTSAYLISNVIINT
jgi:hypothetical protein